MKTFARSVLAMLAIVAVAGAAPPQKAATKTVQGKVTAVAADSLTIQKGSDTMTFSVDHTTKVIGTGVGTKMKQKKAGHEPFAITDAVGQDDMVKVTYDETAGGMHAATVNVTQKSMKRSVAP